MDGFLNVLKPPGMTSSDAVVMVRRRCPKGTKVGHGGTLDPDASGVLPICVGKAARLFDYIIDKKKRYIGELTLGIETDTQDATGVIVNTADAAHITAEDIEAVLPEFRGHIMQIPPQFSAIKRGGVRGYEAARAGQKINIEPRPVVVQNLALIRQREQGKFLLSIECGKGLYVRTLLHDIGMKLHCYGHMSFLLRTNAGSFDIEHALTVEEIAAADDIAKRLIPMDVPLAHLPKIDLSMDHIHAVKNGNPIRASWLDAPIDRPELPQRMYIGADFAGMGEVQADGSVKFKAMLLGGTC